jgi:hypothetical protein
VKILCLSTYPVDEPRHGGQHRLANIIALFRNEGHEVASAGVLGSSAYNNASYFVEYPGLSILEKMTGASSLMEDWAISELFFKEDRYYSKLSEKIPFKPDIIYVEQPWMFKFAKRFIEEKCKDNTILLYGSENIEHELKFSIVNKIFGAKRAGEASQKVLQCEMEAIQTADQVFCVSQNDLNWTAEFSVRPPILAANGVIERHASASDVLAANRITQGRKFGLYCASSHPPNLTGFLDMFGQGAGCFPPDTNMVVAGAAGSGLAHHDRMRQTGSLQRQFIDAGEVSEEVLRGLLATAHAIILPITSGGGTNLKSAEAIWSGQHVVGTTISMRGFEQFSHARGVTIGDEATTFCNAIRETFMKPRLLLNHEERESRSAVLWRNTLAEMMTAVNVMEIAS